MNAKYYTYRNLNYTDHFSTKHRGIVIDYFQSAVIENGRFHVSDAGRDRCLREKKRNVHAFVVSPAEPVMMEREAMPPMHSLAEVKYNPYRANTFVNIRTWDAIAQASRIYLIDGRCFVDHK